MKQIKRNLSLAFQPVRGLQHPWLQTIAANYFPDFYHLPSEKYYQLTLDDGDRLVIAENTPIQWKNGTRIVVLVHGLTGNSDSNYMLRIGHKMQQLGFKVIRMNLRSCGQGFGLAKNPYHSGRSEDTRRVLEWLKEKYPNSPVTQIGFSLGGNITLKMAGEQEPIYNLDSVIAISPPADLIACAKHVAKPENNIFEKYFVKKLVKFVNKIHDTMPELPRPKFPKLMSITEFDDIYTAPRCGFKNAEDYYKQCSSIRYFDNIKIPTFILSALDDPIVDSKVLHNYTHSKNIEIILTKQGGHLGFLGDSLYNIRWMDHVILSWIKKLN